MKSLFAFFAGRRPPMPKPSPWAHRVQAEVFEPRLVLSAQPLMEIAHHALIDHQPWNESIEDGLCRSLLGSNGQSPASDWMAPSIEPMLNEAHAGTGWQEVQKEFGLSGRGQTVAVIDSGIAWDHHALGKGFGAGYRVVGGWDFAENDPIPYDDSPAGFHGTHVAGIIGADGKQQGVAPEVDFVSLRVFNDLGKGQLDWTEKALQWVYQNRSAFESPITTVNLSLGTSWNSNSVPSWGTLEDELKQLHESGIVVVASAGNSFLQYKAPGLSYPASSPYTIPVASVDGDGSLSDFSQRNDRVIAAPGRSILSTVPDHVFGRDGKLDDWSVASGTSMAAPYVAGAAVLIREAMELSGWTQIDSNDIYRVMQDTSDSIWDSLTSRNFDRLDLYHAIDSLIPEDHVGGDNQSASLLPLKDDLVTQGWINQLGDRDVYRFTATKDAQVELHARSDALQGLQWSVLQGMTTLHSTTEEMLRFDVRAGQSYSVTLTHADAIGPYELEWQVVESTASANPDSSKVADFDPATAHLLGTIDYLTRTDLAAGNYRLQASHDGWMTIQLDSDESSKSSIRARVGQGEWSSDGSWSDGRLRLDLMVSSGQQIDLQLIGISSHGTSLDLANLFQTRESSARLWGTEGNEEFELQLGDSSRIRLGAIEYAMDSTKIKSLEVDGSMGNDSIRILGSHQSESVEVRPGSLSLQSTQLNVTGTGLEQISFEGLGGADRAYLYDADTDDILNSSPRMADMTGIGYRYQVSDVDRIFIHATSGGQDIAYLFDSAGDDTLVIRPQFSSLRSDQYFNYISGFERVNAYANAGGMDTAQLYDSSGDDRFATSGEAASIVGSGFFSYTRYFEQVEAYSTAGGRDLASMYAGDRSSITVGTDFVSFQESDQWRLARGFEEISTFVDGQSVSLAPGTIAASVNTVDDAWPSSLPQPMEHSQLPGHSTLMGRSPSMGDGQSNEWLRWNEMDQNRWSSSRTEIDEWQLLASMMEMRRSLGPSLSSAELGMIGDPELEKDIFDRVFANKFSPSGM